MTTDNPSESPAATELEDMSRTDPPSPPTPFGGTNGNHLTVGRTGSGKSYSVARRAGAWWSQSPDRSLVILTRHSCYNGVVGYCDGVQYDGMGLERATRDERLIKPNGVTLVTPGGYGHSEKWGEVLGRFYSRFASFAEEKSGEAAVIVDDVPIGSVAENGPSSYERLLTEENDGLVWRVVQNPRCDTRRSKVENPVAYAPSSAANHLSLSPREYLRQFTAIDLFGSSQLETLGEAFELRDPHRRYLYEEAGVVRTADEDYSTGLGRSAPRDTWYQFKEKATDRERAMLEYRGDPIEFEIEEQL